MFRLPMPGLSAIRLRMIRPARFMRIRLAVALPFPFPARAVGSQPLPEHFPKLADPFPSAAFDR